MEKIKIPVQPCSANLTVKGSKFISNLIPVKTKEQAEQELEKIKKKYYDATHNCYAYRVYPDIEKFSDDGEPSNTAGKPILSAIKGENLFNCLIVVTRYFGGTKLGVGGLIKAYTESAKASLNSVKTVTFEKIKTAKLKVSFNEVNAVYYTVNRNQGIKIIKEEYSNQGISFTIKLKSELWDKFKTQLQEKLNKIPLIEETEEKLDTL